MVGVEPLLQSAKALSPPALAQYFDHTLLSMDANDFQYERLCLEAVDHAFFSVCVPPNQLRFCKQQLTDSDVQLCTVVGFPFGYQTSIAKRAEARDAVSNGVDEIDMVIALNDLKNGMLQEVEQDIRMVVSAAEGKLVKVILETCYLTNDEIETACKLSQQAGAHYVKTSTGFGKGGATAEHIRLMRKTVGNDMGVKASGGIRDLFTAEAMIEAGASRLGASQSADIMREKNEPS